MCLRFINKVRLPVATLILALSNLLLFYYWAGSLLGTPPAMLAVDYSLHISRPVTYFAYTFIHLWPLHLFANLAFLLVLGAIVEARTGPRNFLCFYFGGAALAGVLAALADSALGSGGTIVGASGAVFTLLGGALVLRPLKATLAYLFLSLLVVPVILALPLHEAQSFAKEQAVREVEQIDVAREEAETRYEKKEIPADTYVQQMTELSKELEAPSKQVVAIQQAQHYEESVPTAETVHYAGLLVGFLLMLFAYPEVIDEWRGQTGHCWRELKAHAKADAMSSTVFRKTSTSFSVL